jgi:glycosyltransferase involved in cell wall biosynthesis
MRILFVTDWGGEGGGVETYVTLLMRGLETAGDEVRLLTSSVGSGAAVADYVAAGSRSPVSQSVLQIANPAAARTMRRAVADFRPDVVHVSMFEMHLSPSVVAAAGAVPTVLSILYYKPICPNGLKLLPDDSLCTSPAGLVCWRGGCFPLAHWLRDRPRYARIRHEVHRAAAVVTCSAWMQRALADAGIESSWSPMPIAPPAATFRRAPSQDPLFVFTGRLAREKGVGTLLHALSLARGQMPGIRLRVVGDGPLRSSLEQTAAALALGDAVEFTGWVPFEQVEGQMADAWALVAPSRWAEPLGLNALEAIVRGVPVIASATGGLAESVENGVTGLLFPNGDVSALAGCLVDVATGRQLKAGVPDGRTKAVRTRHDLGRHVDWLRDVFRRVTLATSPRSP